MVGSTKKVASWEATSVQIAGQEVPGFPARGLMLAACERARPLSAAMEVVKRILLLNDSVGVSYVTEEEVWKEERKLRGDSYD